VVTWKESKSIIDAARAAEREAAETLQQTGFPEWRAAADARAERDRRQRTMTEADIDARVRAAVAEAMIGVDERIAAAIEVERKNQRAKRMELLRHVEKIVAGAIVKSLDLLAEKMQAELQTLDRKLAHVETLLRSEPKLSEPPARDRRAAN
jgi:hypothetical protein